MATVRSNSEDTPLEDDVAPRQRLYADPVVVDVTKAHEPLTVATANRDPLYRAVDLIVEGFAPNRETFYEPDYRPTLRRMTAKMIEIEGPIFEDCIVARIAAAHGFGRTGGQIRTAIVEAIEPRFPWSVETSGEGERKIYWPEGADVSALPAFRRENRDHADVPVVEVANLARRFLDEGDNEKEAVRRLADNFELQRLRASARARFQAAVRIAEKGDRMR